jgi:hypothetical protein
MKATVVLAGTLLVGVLWQGPAAAWSSANRYGGSTSHSYGETSRTNAYGGSTSHVYGEGTEHTNAYGGSSTHAYGGGTEHTNAYGGKTYGEYGQGATHTNATGGTVYHPPGSVAYPGYPAYHPPVAVPYYASAGCLGCAAAAGAIVGATAGAAVASAIATAPAGYNVGVATGATPVSVPSPSVAYVMGANYASIPSGCVTPSVQGGTYYLCGNTWFQPTYGANGLFYRVVPTP